MSTDRTFRLMLGFEVPKRRILKTVTWMANSCVHFEDSWLGEAFPGSRFLIQFCQRCGREVHAPKEVKGQILRPQFTGMFACEEQDDGEFVLVGETIWRHKKKPHIVVEKFEFLQERMIAGMVLCDESLPNHDSYHDLDRPKKLPSEREVAAVLDGNGIPFNKTSWGLHTLYEVC